MGQEELQPMFTPTATVNSGALLSYITVNETRLPTGAFTWG